MSEPKIMYLDSLAAVDSSLGSSAAVDMLDKVVCRQ